MSKIEVDAIEPQSGTSLTLGASGDTLTIPSGATLVNNGTATGFFEGIAWQSITTAATLITVAGRGYPINTTSNACTVTLPSSASVGDQVQIVDYAGTFATNNITLTSSLNIEGGALDKVLTTNREGVIITYVDVTQGWVATTGVNSGNQAIDPQTYSTDFLVIAGGGGGSGAYYSGGAGAGGYRNSFASETSGGGGSSETALTFTVGTVYTITVGAGGTGGAADVSGTNGGVSSISGTGITTITSLGGGFPGASTPQPQVGASGGSGGGAGFTAASGFAGGAGTANQGYAGGDSVLGAAATGITGGGGGAGAVGATSGVSGNGSDGGNGLASSITGSSVTRAGGGGGGSYTGGH
jgi:hypothetical protein